MVDVGITLGCYGYSTQNDFCLCNGIENKILFFSNIKEESLNEVIDFLTGSCGLIDKEVVDYNKATNIISYLHKTYGLFADSILHDLQLFLRTHRMCGVYIKLFEENVEDKGV